MSQQQLDTLLQMMKAQPIAQAPSLAEQRAGFEQMAAMFPVDADIKREPVTANGVKAEWVSAPEADPGRAILYLHGGGYVIGSINTHRSLAARLSRAAKARVLVIDYRLAPEHPFPAAVDDSVAAYRWMLAQGLKPSRIAVSGDSAGGGLSAATLVAIRDAKLPLPAAGALLSPWVDMEGIGESMTSKDSVDPMVHKEGLLGMAKAYLGGQNPRSPLAAPLYADLAGLPPLAHPGWHRRDAARRLLAVGGAREEGRRQRDLRAVGEHDPRLPALRADAGRGSAGNREDWRIRAQTRGVKNPRGCGCGSIRSRTLARMLTAEASRASLLCR